MARAELKIVDTPTSYVYEHSYEWGGNNDRNPRTIIAAIDVYESANKSSVPLSAFSDLGTPQIATIAPAGPDGFTLTIVGGDAGSAYKATLSFRHGEILERKVASEEFPDLVWEKTTIAS